MSTAQDDRTIRCLVAKVGLDGHDRGAHVIARAFRDAGFEVIYSGLHQAPDQIVQAAVQEDVDVPDVIQPQNPHLSCCWRWGPTETAIKKESSILLNDDNDYCHFYLTSGIMVDVQYSLTTGASTTQIVLVSVTWDQAMQTQDDQCIPQKSLEELPPSAKFVYNALEMDGALTQSELADQTRLASRTIRDAVTRLEERNLIKTEYCPTDARKRVYSLKID